MIKCLIYYPADNLKSVERGTGNTALHRVVFTIKYKNIT